MTAEVLPLGRLLDGRFHFRLTCFQRAYAWRTEHVTRLINDLSRAMRQRGRKRRYTLGRLMLAQDQGSQDVELVDGHQRLLTLTMVFAVLRDLESDPVRASALHALIADGDGTESNPRRYLMQVQSLPAPLFERMVQCRGGTDAELDAPRELLSETERNILDNLDCIRSELQAPGLGDDFRREFAEFLLNDCYIIAVLVDNQEDAWDIISTEQDTQLSFTHADEAKSVILSAMPPEQQVAASRLWEGCEGLLSPDDLYRVLSHIRALHWRGRTQSSRPVETEIVERFQLKEDGLGFMSQILFPAANFVRDVRLGEVGRPGDEQAEAARLIEMMSWVDPHAWLPPVIQWLRKRGAQDAETVEFLRRLDRLVWLSRIAGVDPGVQETRLLNIITEIEAGLPVANMVRLDIEGKLRSDSVVNLRSANFAAKHFAGILLRRLSILHGADSGPIRRDEVTVEHILPRNPHAASDWMRVFKSADNCRAYYQKLGNVVLLSGNENQLAGTRPWVQKRDLYAQSSFVLARSASEEPEWNVKAIIRRTDRLIDALMASWDLPTVSNGGSEA